MQRPRAFAGFNGGDEQRQDDAAGLTMSMPRRTIVALVAGATVVIIAGIALFIWVFIAPGNTSNQTAPMRMEAAVDESVPYRDASYSLKENNGTYTLVETHTDGSGNEVVLGSLHGAPVCLVLFDGSIAVPENLPDGAWDIAAYTVGTGWGLLSNQSGEAYGGQGTISEAKLDGQTLRLVVDGQPVEVPMEW